MTTSEEQRLVNALTGILRQVLTLQQDASEQQGGIEFYFAEFNGGLNLSPEQSERLREAVVCLEKAYPEVSARTITHELQRFCCQFIQGIAAREALPIPQFLPDLLRRLNSLQNQSTTVYLQVAGLDLKVPEWHFGPGRFLRGDHRDIEQRRLQVVSLDGSVPEPVGGDKVLLELELDGEVEYATERARERGGDVLDVIQFLSLRENSGSWEGDITQFSLFLSEPFPIASSKVWAIGSTGPSWTSKSGTPPVLGSGPTKCLIGESADRRFEARGGPDLAGMLSEKRPSSFDCALQTAVSWIANAIREKNRARKYLSFYIALEALFIRDKKQARESIGFLPAAAPIPEGVAFLLGRTPKDRQALEKSVAELARTRNVIVHRGFTEVDKDSLLRVGTYAWNCCWQTAIRRGIFRSEDSFHDWLMDRKYGNADPPPLASPEPDYAI